MRKYRIIPVLLAAAMLSAACASAEPTDTSAVKPNTTGEDSSAAETEKADPYAGIDLSGMELRFLNYEGRLWNTMSVLDYPELSGVGLDDAVYNRNRGLEDRLNMKIIVTETTALQGMLTKSVSAGEDTFDAVYTMSDDISTNVTGGNLLNLYDIPTLPLEETWWEPGFNTRMMLENKYLYEVSSPIHLMAMDMTVACYFNTEILTDHGVVLPYDTVREGKWTYDAMYAAMTPCLSLNGDEAFTPKAMNATFGTATITGWIGVMVTVPDALVKQDDNGTPYFAGATDRLFSAMDAMTKLFAGDGYMITNSPDMDYDKCFVNERAAFSIISIGNASVFRDMDSAYGILPIPKYLEADADSSPIGSTLLLGVPVTCRNRDNVGIALNAMARWSYENILPVYYESLCYKGLRDEDSVEMLNIIHQSRTADLGRIYGWTSNLLGDLGDRIAKNKSDYASLLAKNEEKIQKNIEKSIAAMRENWE